SDRQNTGIVEENIDRLPISFKCFKKAFDFFRVFVMDLVKMGFSVAFILYLRAFIAVSSRKMNASPFLAKETNRFLSNSIRSTINDHYFVFEHHLISSKSHSKLVKNL